MVAWQIIGIIGATVLIITPIVWFLVWRMIKDYLKGYAVKKGENLATKEDIEDVLQQVKRVTQTTEDIRAEITGDLWSRQKEWELKRDTAVEILKVNAYLREVCISFIIDTRSIRNLIAKSNSQELLTKHSDKHSATADRYSSTTADFWKLQGIAALVFSDSVTGMLRQIQNILGDTVQLAEGDASPAMEQKQQTVMVAWNKQTQQLYEVLRSELGIKGPRNSPVKSE